MGVLMRRGSWILPLTALFVLVAILFSADTLPSQLTDAEYWKMINDFSEPGGFY